MKSKTFIVYAAAGIFLIAVIGGCETRQPHEEVRPVDWYESNPAERAAKLAECKANPSKLDATPNCINASRAENNIKSAGKWGTEHSSVRTEPTAP